MSVCETSELPLQSNGVVATRSRESPDYISFDSSQSVDEPFTGRDLHENPWFELVESLNDTSHVLGLRVLAPNPQRTSVPLGRTAPLLTIRWFCYCPGTQLCMPSPKGSCAKECLEYRTSLSVPTSKLLLRVVLNTGKIYKQLNY